VFDLGRPWDTLSKDKLLWGTSASSTTSFLGAGVGLCSLDTGSDCPFSTAPFTGGDATLLPSLAAGGLDPFCTIGTPLLNPPGGSGFPTCGGGGAGVSDVVGSGNDAELELAYAVPALLSTINILICCSSIDESSGVLVTVPIVSDVVCVEAAAAAAAAAAVVVGIPAKNPLGAAILSGE